MAVSVTRTVASGQQFPRAPVLSLSQSRVGISAQPSSIRQSLGCGGSSNALSASKAPSPCVTPPMPRHHKRQNRILSEHVESLTTSRRSFTSLQSGIFSNGRLQRHIAGNYGMSVVAAGSRRGLDSTDQGQSFDIPLLGEFRIPDIRQNLSEVTPAKAAKWATIVAVAYAAMSIVASLTVFNGNFWMYASWLGVVWQWPVAIIMGLWTLLGALRQANSKIKEEEQVFIVGGALVWLILVPLAHVHGFVDGWPILLYSLYYFFFSISAIVRSRLYDTLSTAPEDKRLRSSPQAMQIAFMVALVGGHWAAAFESPFLVESWNWAWQSKIAAALLALAVVVQWNAAYFLGKYSDRLVNPKAVVAFGPYRWVRHPMYASYMLLCAGYCLALRSYFSLLFLIISCVAYYDQRTKLEEEYLVEVFGTSYTSYREKTKHKYLPWLY